MTKSAVNLGIFLIATPVSLVLAGNGRPDLAMITVAAACAVLLKSVPVPAKEGLLLMTAAAAGWAWESLLMNAGLVQFHGQDPGDATAPLWSVAPWLLLATTLNHGLRHSKRSVGTSTLTGIAIGLSVLNLGALTGALVPNSPAATLVAYCLGWGALLPLMNLAADTIIDSELFEPAMHADRDSALRKRLPVLEQNVRGALTPQPASTPFPGRRPPGGDFFPANP